jgi:hypothetical protein
MCLHLRQIYDVILRTGMRSSWRHYWRNSQFYIHTKAAANKFPYFLLAFMYPLQASDDVTARWPIPSSTFKAVMASNLNLQHIGVRFFRMWITLEIRKLVPIFLWIEGATWSARRIPTVISRFYRPEPLLFLPSSSATLLTMLSGHRSRPTASQKIWYCRESNPDLWICSQELWPLDHRGGLRICITEFN